MTQWSEPPVNGGAVSDERDPKAHSVDLKRQLSEAKSALVQSREELRLALASAVTGLWQYDLGSGEITGSDVFLTDLGLTHDAQLTLEKLRSRCHPQDLKRVKDTIERAVATRSDFDVTFRITRLDGSAGHLTLKGCAIYAKGKPIRLIGTTQRISDADQATRDINAAQRRQKFLLDLRDSIRDIDDSSAIIDTATRELGMFLVADRVGYGAAKLSGEVANREWVHDSAKQTDRSYNLEAKGAVILSELKQGRTVLINDAASDVRVGPDAKIYYAARQARSEILIPLIKGGRLKAALYVSSAKPYAFSEEDVTLAEAVAERIWDAAERAQVESDLRESEARLRIVAETLPALVWIINPDLELVYANARWSRYAGLPESESLGTSWMPAIHPDDLARIVIDMQAVRRAEAAYTTEGRYRNLDGVYRWHMIRAEPIHDARGVFKGWSGTSVDIHDLKKTEEALRKNEAQLRLALQVANMGVWNWDRATDSLELAEGAAELFGLDPARKMTLRQFQKHLNPADATRVVAAMERAIETGEPYNIEYRITRKKSGSAWIVTQGQTTYGADGTPSGMTGVVQDITDRKLAEERQNLLIRELHHRVKNTLATVQAIVGSTARTASSIDEFYQGFVGRIVSLARTHNLLTEDIWQKASLGQLVKTELGPYDDDNRNRVTIEGPPVELPSEAAVPIGMAIHELTTNAAKHGALSTFGGQVDVRWHLDGKAGAPILHFIWIERGGPRVVEPRRQGFGSRLLRRVLTTQLGADVHMDFQHDGLRFTMIMPVPGEPPLFNPDL